MNLEIKKELLMKHLNYVIKGVSNKNLRPILNCIKFDLKDEGLYLMSTDNEIAIQTFISKKEIEHDYQEGQIVLSGKYIYDIVRKMPNELIKIEEISNYQVLIKTTNSSFTLNENDVSEFPNLNLEEKQEPILINSQVFKNIVNQTSFATSLQESRPVLTGINFKINKNTLECTATDSYRLAKKIVKLDKENNEDVNIIIPNKNLIEVTKLLEEKDSIIEMHIFNNKVIFKFGTIIVLTRLINGSYPDTSKLIPKEYMLDIELNLNNFYDLLDRVSLLSNEEEKNTINLESNDKIITVSSNIPEIGKVEEKIEINKSNDENIKISFSSKYMMDAIKTFSTEKIKLSFNGEIKPIIVKNIDDDNLIQLILPIRTY